MRCFGILLFLLVIAGTMISGCTQSQAAATVTPATPAATVTAPPATSIPVPDPTPAGTPVPEATPTGTPQGVVTIVHQVSLTRDIKDSALLYSLQVPVEWTVVKYRLENPENFEGFMYETDLIKNGTFYIHTFSNYHWREQNYRDDALRWLPAPNKTTVSINGLTFDRYQSVAANGTTRVMYVPGQCDVNDYGLLSVLAFNADPANRFAVEDYDKVVASFRYYSKDKVGTMPGTEIREILPDDEDAGSVRSAVAGGSSSLGSRKSSAPTCPNKR